MREGQIARCFCGEYEENHWDRDESLKGIKWSDTTHLKYIEPTLAFGQIDFLTESNIGQRRTEFVRISDKDKLEDVMELMTEHWHMMEPVKPSLCISVIGGAKNFVLEGRKKDVFNTGLIQAAKTTNAWIVTSGLNLGIVRVVGDALEEGQTWHFDRRRLSNQLRCLGISPWGYVLNREDLICDNYVAPVSYRVSNVIETGRPVSLNENHTHYIFVDEGRRLRYGGSESARFRARLGKQMALPPQAGGWGIPVVLVVVEGGHDVFIDARDCIRERIPVVICSGTGRAADVMDLAFLFRMKQQDKEFTSFRPEEAKILLQKLVPISGEEKVNHALTMITEILNDPKLITTFDMNKSDDLDLAILFALIKTNSRIDTQLKLAFFWDRSDIAEEKIFQQGVRVEPASLEPTMMDALLSDKPEFVRILLQNGVVMRQFLTVERLHELYNKSTHREAFERCLSQKGFINPVNRIRTNEQFGQHTDPAVTASMALSQVNTTANRASTGAQDRKPIYLSIVSRLIRKMIGRFSNRIYEQDTEDLRHHKSDWELFKKFTFISPFQELFLWAILHHRQHMALFFWERAEDSLALALIACALYTDMIKSLPDYDTEMLAEYTRCMDEFEVLAVQLLEECYAVDPETTLYLIENEAPLWGGYNCLNLADKATRRKFISSVACQNSLFYAWSHGTQATPLAFTMTLFCPFLLLSKRFVEFDEDRIVDLDEDQFDEQPASIPWRESSSNVDQILDSHVFSSSGFDIEFGPGRRNLIDQRDVRRSKHEHKKTQISFRQKLKVIYTAPRTKFFLNTIAYITFLLFFSYTLLFRIIRDKISVEEAVTMAYFITLLIDIIRQICVTPGAGSFKLRLWVKVNSLVYLDIIAMLLALISMFLRIGLASTFIVSKTFYALTLIVCYTRVFRLYGFHPALGPKLVMIERMIAELVLFLFILAVILVSYGVAVQSLLYPYRTTFDWNAIRDVFYYPYWNLYGELSLEYSFAINSDCSDNADGINCPQFNFVVPLLLAFYLLLAGILLINLLIAIFSNVFEQVEDNSIELWKFNMYALVVEYNKKPVAPVPLSAIQALVELCQYLIRKCNRSPGVTHGVKQIANKTTDIQSSITMGPTKIVEDLIDESEDRENANDEGAQLFQFINNRGSRKVSALRDLPAASIGLREKTILMNKISKVIEADEEDENMRLARLFETNCKRNYLRKRKHVEAQTIDAGISLIKKSIEKLQSEIIGVADRLEAALRESQMSSDVELKSPSLSPDASTKLDNFTGRRGKSRRSSGSQRRPTRASRFVFPSGPDRPSSRSDWSFGQEIQTPPIGDQLDLFDQAVDQFNNQMDKPHTSDATN